MNVTGRFAPSPSGRMHLGNLLCCLLAWLSAKKAGGTVILRIEDLDTRRCPPAHARQLLEDLRWLGLTWDAGPGTGGPDMPYYQSRRTALYQDALDKLTARDLVYPCFCTRAERLAASAPHRADGVSVYDGRCARLTDAEREELSRTRRPAWRVRVPEREIRFTDLLQGGFGENLARDCGDFIVRRSDGVFAYQLAVVVDDALMGVNHVVRGRDLLCSAPRQAWLHKVLGYEPPRFFHTPLLLAPGGRRLAKRDHDLDMDALRERYTAEELTGLLACYAGLLDRPEKVTGKELVPQFSWAKVTKNDVVVCLS